MRRLLLKDEKNPYYYHLWYCINVASINVTKLENKLIILTNFFKMTIFLCLVSESSFVLLSAVNFFLNSIGLPG